MSFLKSLGGVLSGAAEGWNDPTAPGRALREKRVRAEESETRMKEAKRLKEIDAEADDVKEARADKKLLGHLTSVFGGDATKAAEALAEAKSATGLTSVTLARKAKGMLDKAGELGASEAAAGIAKHNAQAKQSAVDLENAASALKVGLPEKQTQRNLAEAVTGRAMAESEGRLLPTRERAARLRGQLDAMRDRENMGLVAPEADLRQRKMNAEASDLARKEALAPSQFAADQAALGATTARSDILGNLLRRIVPGSQEEKQVGGLMSPSPSKEEVDVRSLNNRFGNFGIPPEVDLNNVARAYGFASKGSSNAAPNNVPSPFGSNPTGNGGIANNAGSNPAGGLSSVPARPNPPESGNLYPNTRPLRQRSFSTVPVSN